MQNSQHHPTAQTLAALITSLAILLVSFLAPAPTAAVVLNIEFEQLTFLNPPEEPVEFSDLGRCMVEFAAEPQMEFLNLAAIVPGLTAEPVWIVRNLPLHDDAVGMPVETVGVRIPLDQLGVEAGMPVASIACGWTVTPVVMTDDEVVSWLPTVPLDPPQPVPVAEVDDGDGFDRDHLPEVIDPRPWWWPSFVPGMYLDIVAWIGCRMPNVDLAGGLEVNGCAPAGCANSIRWLADNNDNIDLDENESEAFDQLSHLMSRLQAKGVGDSTMVKAKLDFIEAHGLPIEVKFQSSELNHGIVSSTGKSAATDSTTRADGWPSASWLLSEARDKEDVEIGIGRYYRDNNGNSQRAGGHVVTLTGAMVIGDHIVICWKHDDQQSVVGGTYQEIGFADTSGGRIYIPGLDGEIKIGGSVFKTIAKVESVISESPLEGSALGPVPEPMPGFCSQHKRMIAPGDTFKVEFPPIPKRNLNVTMWVYDTSVQPHRMVREVVWNKNSGKTRRWVNRSNVPVMIVVHNDDDARDEETGEPMGFHVDESIGRGTPQPGKGATEESPDNQEESGGFSLGWADGSASEFGNFGASGFVPVGPVQNGFSLDAVPPRMSAGGVQTIEIQVPIPVWHNDWTYLRFIIDAAAVHSPGQLQVQCVETGDDFLLDIPAAAGRFEQMLSALPPIAELNLRLTVQGGLDFEIDCMGAPTILGATTGVRDQIPALTSPRLDAWPNPANPKVMLRVELPDPAQIELAVWDLRGRRVALIRSGPLAAGEQTFTWEGTDDSGRQMAAGAYIIRLVADGFERMRKVSLVR